MQLPVSIGEHAIRLSPTSPEREGRAESDRMPHRVQFQNLAVDPQPPAQSPGEEPLADRRRPFRLDPFDRHVPEPARCISNSQTTSTEACTRSAGHTFTAIPVPSSSAVVPHLRKPTAGLTHIESPAPSCTFGIAKNQTEGRSGCHETTTGDLVSRVPCIRPTIVANCREAERKVVMRATYQSRSCRTGRRCSNDEALRRS
jgi:hypothetical protein